MKKTRSILMVVLMLVVALSLSGCTLFGNKDKVEKEDNAQVAARGVMLAITDEDAEANLSKCLNSKFEVNIGVKVGNDISVKFSNEYESPNNEEINSLFKTIRDELLHGSSGILNLTYKNADDEKDKVTVQVGSGASADIITAFCNYEVKLGDTPITKGKITFTMKSDNQNNVVITGIEIVINVLNN